VYASRLFEQLLQAALAVRVQRPGGEAPDAKVSLRRQA
jgi:hypothetical protein